MPRTSLLNEIKNQVEGISATPEAGRTPRIAIIGGGLAGLTCAYRLNNKGFEADVYEASDRLGGRCWTGRGLFEEKQIIEHGGELIDSGHHEVLSLVRELRLSYSNLFKAEKEEAREHHQKKVSEYYYVNGVHYACEQATEDIQKVYPQLNKDFNDSYPATYDNYSQRAYELDHMSIHDWIEMYVPGGVQPNLGKLLEMAYVIEYGASIKGQSALNLIYLLGDHQHGELKIFGPSNEKFHVNGGNDQIVTELEKRLNPARIHKGHILKAIRQDESTVTMTFNTPEGEKEIIADKVVLAIPFSILRATVDFGGANFSPLKITAIEELGMGRNSKLQLQYTDRHWVDLGYTGETFSDDGLQSTWEPTRGQDGKAGILVNFTGGDYAASMGEGTPEEHAVKFNQQLEPIFPGISEKWNKRVALNDWPGEAFTLGSYAYWRVGQVTKFVGIEKEPEGNIHFAGEHTSYDSLGYLNGGVETGERAAGELIEQLLVTGKRRAVRAALTR